MNGPQRTTKRRLLALLFLIVMFAAAAVLIGGYKNPSVGNQVVPAVSGGFGSSGMWETTYQDIFGITMFTTYFEANWTYAWGNCYWIYGYYIFCHDTHVNWYIISWINTQTPLWAYTAPDKWVGFGTGHYHIGIWYL